MLYIRGRSNLMIARWNMALMEFSFTFEFIADIDSDIADAMLRLCHNNMLESPKEYSKEIQYSLSIIEKFKLTKDLYRKIGRLQNSVSALNVLT